MSEAPKETRSPADGRKPRSRVARGLASVVALAAAGALSVYAAIAAVGFLEERRVDQAQAALETAGFDWVSVEGSGLQLHLRGTAPDEAKRFRALTLAEGAIDGGQVIDEMEVAPVQAVKAPDFSVELLRNDEGVSVIGLVPASIDRDKVVERLTKTTGGAKVTDLLETADYAVPQSWQSSFDFGLRAAEIARRAKVSIATGRVVVTAIADSREDKAAIEAALRRAKPADVALTTNISAPRPVISPFTLRFVKDEDGARFDACAADTEEARGRILEAAKRAGQAGASTCQLGLGAPSNDWASAAVAAIDAVTALKGGQVTMSDTDIALHAPAGTPQAEFDETVGRLQAALPRLYSLTAVIEQGGQTEGPAEFSAVSDAKGRVVLRGRITDQRMREAVESFARSRFGQIDSALRLDPDVPSGWTVRVIAALEGMAELKNGSARVSPDLIRITGSSGDQTASDKAATALAERLGAGANYELAIRYDRRLDPLLGLPSGEECVDRLNNIMQESLIGFEPNKAVIAGDPEPTLKALAEGMQDCQEFRIELGGHTDSQGSDAFNAELSRKRAQVVLEAMTKHGIDTALMSAKGYGESQPIADNATEAGREANRRIEFKLLSEAPVQDAPKAVQTLSGVTEELPEAETQGPEQPAASGVAGEGNGQASGTPTPLAPPHAEAQPPVAAEAAPDEPQVGAPQAEEPLLAETDRPALDPDSQEYALMVATILVTELAQSQELGGEGMPFDTFDAEDGGPDGLTAENDLANPAAAEAPPKPEAQPEATPAAGGSAEAASASESSAAATAGEEKPSADQAASDGASQNASQQDGAKQDAAPNQNEGQQSADPQAATGQEGAGQAETGQAETGQTEPVPSDTAQANPAQTSGDATSAAPGHDGAVSPYADLRAEGLPDLSGAIYHSAEAAPVAGLAQGETGASLQVQTPDDTTPRPKPRPTP
ncbi:OmpA family protein [Paracoccus aminophilus]|uniref:OmpA/MotB domain-containing protein n=1 Tax=Paracoccus aminophilus JCM 7686 TaxID=1367847 RepID=S5XR65_PARAH|nr:OmpA family protein [Paracoccus aminophilus]AGT07542.1 OmpA/MotB domain-containing protein [Paracoccus aminophilus JCM 7686]